MSDSLVLGINSIKGMPFQALSVSNRAPHIKSNLRGWIGIETWRVISKDGVSWNIDWRLAFKDSFIRQNCVDFFLYYEEILEKSNHGNSYNKVIVYIVSPELSRLIDYPIDYKIKIQADGNQSFWHTVPIKHHVDLKHQEILHAVVQYGSFSSSIRKILKISEFIDINFDKEIKLKNLETKIRVDGVPKITIITVVFNNVEQVEQTIQSVINQSIEYEYILIDGGSSDGTVDLIKKYKKWIDYHVSESDSGIYDAMNKGLLASTGDWTLFINSDDVLLDLTNVVDKLSKIDVDCLCAKVINLGKYSSWIRPNNTPVSDINAYSHQSVITKNNFLFDTRYQLIADSLYMDKYQSSFYEYDQLISIFRVGGVSSCVGVRHILEYCKTGNFYRAVRAIIKMTLLSIGLNKVVEKIRRSIQQ